VKKWERKARKLPLYIGYLVACVEKGIEPVGKDGMCRWTTEPWKTACQ